MGMHGKYITFRNIHRKTYCLDDYGKHVINNKYRTLACSNENKNQWFLLKSPKQKEKLYPEGYFNIIGKSGLCVSSREKNRNLSHNKIVEIEIIYYGKLKNIKMDLSLKTQLKELCTTQETICLDTLEIIDGNQFGLSNLLCTENTLPSEIFIEKHI